MRNIAGVPEAEDQPGGRGARIERAESRAGDMPAQGFQLVTKYEDLVFRRAIRPMDTGRCLEDVSD